MGLVLIVALVLGAAPADAPECPGDADKPLVLRCQEAGDHAGAMAAARAEIGRSDATPSERRFAVTHADIAARKLLAADQSPAHLCELAELLAEYIATPEAAASATARREAVTRELRQNYPEYHCDGEAPSSGPPASTSSPDAGPPASTSPPSSPPPPPPRSVVPRVPPRRAVPSRRKVPGMTIGGGALLVAAAGLGGGALGLAVTRDDLRDRARALRSEVDGNGGQVTPAIEQERERILEVDRRTHGAMVACIVSSSVFAALGVGLVVAGERGRVRRRAEVAPYGGAQGAGFVLRGRF